MTTKVLVGFSRWEIFKVTLTEHFRAAIGWAFAHGDSFETTEQSDAAADFKAREFAQQAAGVAVTTMDATPDFWCSYESVKAALDHVEQHNGPGRKVEALRMLCMWGDKL